MDNMKELKRDRKPYEAPAIIFESPLEVRAGTPLNIFDIITDKASGLTDPAGLAK